MNILYLSQYFPPEACAPAARVDEFARQWARAGHDVRVLTGFPNHPEGVVHPDYRRAWRRCLHRERQAGVEIVRTWLYPTANRGLWGRAANYVSFAMSAAAVGPWVALPDSIVVATSPQLLVGAAGYAVARARRLPFVFEVRDLWPQSLEGVGAAGRSSVLYRSLKRLADFLYRRADRIVVVGRGQKQALVKQGVEEAKISVVMNGVSDEFMAGTGHGRGLRRDMDIEGKFVVSYCGTLGMAHGLESVLDAAALLQATPDVIVLLAGAGAEGERLAALAGRMRLPNVRFLGKLPRERVPALLAASDACLVPLRRSEILRTAIPSKMFEAMAAARPVLLAAEGEAREILDETHAGVAVGPEDPEALARAVLRLRADPTLCRELGENGRRAARERFSRSKQARSYLKTLCEVSAGAARRHESCSTANPAGKPAEFVPILTVREP